MQNFDSAETGIQELSTEDVDQVSGGVLFVLLASYWAATHNGGAYNEDRGAGAWG